jgi:hypothetical protein
MVLGTTQISKIMNEVLESITQKQKAESLTLQIQGVNKARVEDLMNF